MLPIISRPMSSTMHRTTDSRVTTGLSRAMASSRAMVPSRLLVSSTTELRAINSRPTEAILRYRLLRLKKEKVRSLL